MALLKPRSHGPCVHLRHHPLPTAHLDELARLWYRLEGSEGATLDESRTHVFVRFFLRSRTIRAMRSAASAAASCDQMRTTSQPSCSRRLLVSASRARFASIFSRQKSAFFLGHVACSGQPCQKHPSTNTATRGPGNTMSATRRGLDNNG